MILLISGQVVLVGRVEPVNLLEARIELAVAGPGREFRQLEVVIDTGFTGWLTLNKDLVDELNLTGYGSSRNVLADGQEVTTDIYGALISWGGQSRPVIVHQVESGRPLVGTAMLENCRLTIDMWEGGLVSIQPNP